MNKLQTAKDFAMWLNAKNLDIENIILYGSVAKKGDGNDIDILLPHNNVVFSDLYKDVAFENVPQIYSHIDTKLKEKGYPSIADLTKIDSCLEALTNNTLKVTFVESKIFRDRLAYEKELNLHEDKKFFHNILSYARIWDPIKQDYAIPMNSVYSIPKELATVKKHR